MTLAYRSLEELVSRFLFLPTPYYKASPLLDPLSIFALSNSSSATVADYPLLDGSVKEESILDIAFNSIDRLQARLSAAQNITLITHYQMTSQAKSLVSLLSLEDAVDESTSPKRSLPKNAVVVTHVEADIIETIALLQSASGVRRADPLSIRLDSASMTAISLFQSIFHQNLALIHEVIPGLTWHLHDEKQVLQAQYALRDKRFDDLPNVVQIALILCRTLQDRPPAIQMEGVITLVQTVIKLHPLRAQALQTAAQLLSGTQLEDINLVSHLTASHLCPETIISNSTVSSLNRLDYPISHLKEAVALSL
jgi:hypothetical protein